MKRRIVTEAKACTTLVARHERAIEDWRRRLDERAPLMSQQEIDHVLLEICGHEDKLSVLHRRCEDCAQELEALGAFLDDPEEGVVKFYGEMDSRIVYLTWKLGEPEVAFWHAIDGDFADRRPLDGDERVAHNTEA